MDEKFASDLKAPSWIRHRWTNFLDGPQRWGKFHTSVGRYGAVNHWLVLYPPGTNVEQRRALQFCDSWRTVGLVVAYAMSLVLAVRETPLIIIVLVAAGVYAMGVVVTRWFAAPVRTRVVRLCAGRSTLAPDPDRTEECDYLLRLMTILTAAEDALDSGTTSPAVHERVWSAVYDEAKEHLDRSVSPRGSSRHGQNKEC